ncbi:MAG TPA: hypothetical protein VMI56_09210 [Reyranella sp.]|nr:hypothetical protein [Reyranella sp.]
MKISGIAVRLGIVLLGAVSLAAPAAAQITCDEGMKPLEANATSRMGAMDFIHDVAAREMAFTKAMPNFNYTVDVTVQTLQGDKVDGTFHKLSHVTYDSVGTRTVQAVAAPTDTLTRAKISDADLEGLRDAFMLSSGLLAERDIVYAGRQEFGNINTAVFDVLPRTVQAGEKGFQGRVWVRISEDAVIRSCGRITGGALSQLRYQVQRTRVADKYYFPGLIHADEETTVGTEKVRFRVLVKYSDYAARQ